MGIYTRSGGRDVSLENVIDARNVLWDTFTLVALIGDDSTWGRASALMEFVTDVAQGRSGFVIAKWNELIGAFIQASRLELIPNPDLHSPVPLPSSQAPVGICSVLCSNHPGPCCAVCPGQNPADYQAGAADLWRASAGPPASSRSRCRTGSV